MHSKTSGFFGHSHHYHPLHPIFAALFGRPSVDAGPRIAATCAQLGVLGERECGWSVHRLDTISLNGPRRERAVVAGRRPTDPLPSNHPRHRSSRSLAVLSPRLVGCYSIATRGFSRRKCSSSIQSETILPQGQNEILSYDHFEPIHTVEYLESFQQPNPLYFAGAVNVAGRGEDDAVLLKRYDTYTSH